MSKETIDLKDLDDLLCKYEVKDLEDLENRFKNVADLEAKLAESENKFIVANNLRKNSDEVLLNYKTKKYGLDKTIQELRKTKLSLPEKEWYYKGFENCERQMSSHIADLTLEVKELKQQLRDLPKKIVEEIRDCLLDVSNGWWRYFMTDGCEYLLLSDLQGCLDETIDTILKKYGGE